MDSPLPQPEPGPIRPIQNPSHKTILFVVASFLILMGCLAILGFFLIRSWSRNQVANRTIPVLTPTATPTIPVTIPPPSITPILSPEPTDSPQKDVEIALLKKEIEILNGKISHYETNVRKALAYSDAFSFLVDMLVKHGGMTGWTQDDYNSSLEKAKATGDQDLIKATQDAWNNPYNQSPEVRLALVLVHIKDGIGEYLRRALNP